MEGLGHQTLCWASGTKHYVLLQRPRHTKGLSRISVVICRHSDPLCHFCCDIFADLRSKGSCMRGAAMSHGGGRGGARWAAETLPLGSARPSGKTSVDRYYRGMGVRAPKKLRQVLTALLCWQNTVDLQVSMVNHLARQSIQAILQYSYACRLFTTPSRPLLLEVFSFWQAQPSCFSFFEEWGEGSEHFIASRKNVCTTITTTRWLAIKRCRGSIEHQSSAGKQNMRVFTCAFVLESLQSQVCLRGASPRLASQARDSC